MSLKRFVSTFAVLAASIGFAVLPGSQPVAATAPTVIDIVGVPGAFGSNAAGFCAITQTGSNKELYCWGVNFSGRLGVGDTNARNFPTKALPNPASGFTNTNVTAVAMGAMSVCAIEGGSVYCAGVNSSGQLGNGTTTDSPLFVKVADNNTVTPPVMNSGFSKIAVGNNTACGLKMSMLYCWGADTYGLIGDGAGSTSGSTRPIMLSDASPFINGAISDFGLSGKHACLLRDMGQANDKKIYCWGMTGASAVGGAPTYDLAFRNVATIVPNAAPFTNGNVDSISVGEEGTCVVDAGVVRCFGADNGGNISAASSPGPKWPAVTIPDASPWSNSHVSKVFAGATSACALKSGAVYCWGNDFSGSLGDGVGANAGRGAVKVASSNGFSNTNVTKVAIAAQAVCALEGGSLWCWGIWGSGLGSLVPNGATADVFEPVAAVWPVPPTVTSSPATVSPNGGTITIAGSGFSGTTSVSIDSTVAQFSVTNAGSIDIIVPALAAGTYTISITTPGGVITQSLTIGAAPTTTIAPTTTTPSGGGAAPQLVTSANQGQLNQTAGGFIVIQNGYAVSATLTRVNAFAASAAATPPAQRSADQVAELQVAGASLLAAFQASLPQGATSNVTVSNTTTGAVLRGLAQDASGNAVDVPVEDVLLITTPSSALLLAGVNASNAAANLSASGVLEIGPGGVINVAGSGLPNSGAAELVVMSTPRLLKSFTAGADGTFADRASLPSDLPAGNHTVVLAGSGIYMAVGITVGATTLPTTGGDSSAVVVVALLIFALAAVLVRSRRLATITR